MNEAGTYRYIQNIAGWTARPEVFISSGRGPNPLDWRPDALNYTIIDVKTSTYNDEIQQLISKTKSCRNNSTIRQNVRSLGGNIFGVIRFSIQWNDTGDWDKNDLDAHCIEPRGNEIMNKLSYNSVDKSINLYDFLYIWLLIVKKIINLHCEKLTVKNLAKILHHLL